LKEIYFLMDSNIKVSFILLTLAFISVQLSGQTTITFQENAENKLYIKLYGHIDYNQKLEPGIRNAGKMDVHRLVTLFGYQFGRNTQFVSEIEVEHVKEIFVEQAFVKHRLSRGINLKAGLLLVPMGFVNEMHEPTFFYSVERPLMDKLIIPTTWREIGLGITGLLTQHSLKYQLYLINSPLGYDGEAKVSGKSGIRSARQKGAESVISTFPGVSFQVEYFGVANMKVGLSGYHGKTNTTLYNEFPAITPENTMVVDSSTVTMSMATLHASYSSGPWTMRGQYTLAGYGNTAAYNNFSQSDVPEIMHGYYVLAAYDFAKSDNITVSPFIRFSQLDNHLVVNETIARDAGLKKTITTIGMNYKPHPGVVFKADYQFYNIGGDASDYNQFNAGVGVWF